jgi:hypothetical protein
VPDLTPGDITLGTKESVGRYFGLVSVIPSLVLAFYLYLLLASGALTGPPSAAHVVSTVVHNPAQSIAVAAAAVVLALIMHPMQFAMVQTLEGYTWGRTAVGRELQARKAVNHLIRLGNARLAADSLRRNRPHQGQDETWLLLYGTEQQRLDVMRWRYHLAAAILTIEQYPVRAVDILPTRLGNMLRRHELAAGAAYGIEFIPMSTHIGLVADPSHLEYMQDQRNAVDLGARMCITALLATLATIGVMWPHGLWLLTALIPFAAAYVTYRGAVGLASHYGDAMIAVADLNRFRLYASLNLPIPPNTSAERDQNSQLLKLRAGDSTLEWTYAAAPAETPEDGVDHHPIIGA